MKFKVVDKIKTITSQKRGSIDYEELELDRLHESMCNIDGIISGINTNSSSFYSYNVNFNSTELNFPMMEEELIRLNTNIKLYKRIIKWQKEIS